MSEPIVSGDYRVTIHITKYENGTYRATEHGVQASGVGDNAFEAIRDYLSEVEALRSRGTSEEHGESYNGP